MSSTPSATTEQKPFPRWFREAGNNKITWVWKAYAEDNVSTNWGRSGFRTSANSLSDLLSDEGLIELTQDQAEEILREEKRKLPMKLYKIKASVTEEMLGKICLEDEHSFLMDGQFSAMGSGDLYGERKEISTSRSTSLPNGWRRLRVWIKLSRIKLLTICGRKNIHFITSTRHLISQKLPISPRWSMRGVGGYDFIRSI